MLRVRLTGGLGSGKSTVAKILAAHGAYVLQADEIGRDLMRRGELVYAAIAKHFGPGVVGADGELDRAELARLAFRGGRLEELNAIVHPAVIARQAEMVEEIAAREPKAVAVVESALIFETKYGGEPRQGGLETSGDEAEPGGWRRRFDRIVLVTAPEELKIARFVARSRIGVMRDVETAELEAEARRRLGQQIGDEQKAVQSDYVIENGGSLEELQAHVEALWPRLVDEAERQTSAAGVDTIR